MAAPPGAYTGHYMVAGSTAYATAHGMPPGTAVLLPAGAAMMQYGGGIAYQPAHGYHPPPGIFAQESPQHPAAAGPLDDPQAGFEAEGGQENMQVGEGGGASGSHSKITHRDVQVPAHALVWQADVSPPVHC
jgi:hypothetical protein